MAVLAAFFGASVTSLSLSAPAFAASQHLGQRVLREGMTGHDVRVLQQYLTFAGFPTTVDGDFGPTTEAHVLSFERKYRLPANGIVSAPFVAKIRAIVADREGTAAVANSSGGVGFTVPTSPAPTTPEPTTTPGAQATLVNGLAVPPADAPTAVKNVIYAANKIATKPYIYGGGHASFTSAGYDCSGSVSYALHGGGLLSTTMDSTDFESYGSSGPGQWITLWTNAGHVYMQVAGLWFDTAAQSSSNGNDRWSTTRVDSPSGYIVRHPTGY